MDLEILAGVQEQIIGNCLCVLGDSMAMPLGSLVKHFREEFEAHIEAARAHSDLAGPAPTLEPSEAMSDTHGPIPTLSGAA